MGFIKRSDGDADNVVDRVFENVGELLDEIVEHTIPDGLPPEVVEIPGAELPPDEKAN